MDDSTYTMRVGAIAAVLAALLIVGITFVPWPFDFPMPGDAAISGEVSLNLPEAATFADSVRVLFSIDGVFILCWIVAWIGLSVLVKSRHEMMGQLALVIGLIGPLLDFSENAIMWAITQGIAAGIDPPFGWATAWRVVRHLSYWIPYIAAVIAMVGLWRGKLLDRIICIISVVVMVPGIIGLYVPALELISSVWFLVWFILIAILLWRYSAQSEGPRLS